MYDNIIEKNSREQFQAKAWTSVNGVLNPNIMYTNDHSCELYLPTRNSGNISNKKYQDLHVKSNIRGGRTVRNYYRKCHKKTFTGPLGKFFFEFNCMRYVEYCKICLSHPGMLETKINLKVLYLHLSCRIFGASSNWRGHPIHIQ